MKTILNIIFVFLSFYLNAQKVYYKTFEGLVLTEENYLANKKEIAQREDLAEWLYEIPIKTEIKGDSIIRHVKFELITAMNLKGERIDPFKSQRKIGTHFPIETFKDRDGNYFKEDYLKGKPTVVNFWFTDCPPCIKELPDLYNLHREFGDSVNLIAITFEKRKAVEKFVERKRFFHYLHITDAGKEIGRMKVQSYPITFLLNNEGKIMNVYGDLTAYYQKLRELLLRLF